MTETVLAETPEVETPTVDTAPEAPTVPESAPDAPDLSEKAQKRINELIRRNKELEFQLQKPKEPEKPLTQPTLEETGYDEAKHKKAMDAYYEALIDRRAEEKVTKVLTDREQKAKAAERDQAFSTEFSKLSPVERSTAEAAIVTEFAANLIKESPIGVKIALHLGENTELANQIARLPDHLQAKEIGKLEARLEGKPVTQDAPAVSKAPPPARRLEATDASTPVKADSAESDKLSDAEWKKLREKQVKQRRN